MVLVDRKGLLAPFCYDKKSLIQLKILHDVSRETK